MSASPPLDASLGHYTSPLLVLSQGHYTCRGEVNDEPSGSYVRVRGAVARSLFSPMTSRRIETKEHWHYDADANHSQSQAYDGNTQRNDEQAEVRVGAARPGNPSKTAERK